MKSVFQKGPNLIGYRKTKWWLSWFHTQVGSDNWYIFYAQGTPLGPQNGFPFDRFLANEILKYALFFTLATRLNEKRFAQSVLNYWQEWPETSTGRTMKTMMMVIAEEVARMRLSSKIPQT